jgi:levanase
MAMQESLVVAIADGFSRASGRLVACNVHVAPGLGNAMGSLYNAQFTGTPMILTAGQQEQGHGLMEPLLFGPLVRMAEPLVKWAVEVTRLEDLPRIVRRAAKVATTPPTGPVFADFEGTTWGTGWTATGDFTNAGPVAGGIGDQQPVSGYLGSKLVNTFLNHDASTGTITSPPFTINSNYIDFLVGGGNHPAVPGATQGDPGGTAYEDFENLDPATHLPAGWTATGDFVGYGAGPSGLPSHQGANVLDTCVVPDKCDSATGTFVSPTFTVNQPFVNLLVAGGTHPLGSSGPTDVELVAADGHVVGSVTGNNSGEMDWRSIDAASVIGTQAHLIVRDDHSGGDWGHLMVDDIRFSGTAAGPRDTQTTVNLVVGGAVVRSTTGSDSESLDWASWNVADLAGKQAQIRIVDHNSGGWGHILADQFTAGDAPALDGVHRAGWVDYGRDNYAGVTFSGLPIGQRTFIGWMNNWQYAGDVPTDPWRGQMTMPRQLSLVTTTHGLRLQQTPVAGIDAVTHSSAKTQSKNRPVAAGTTPTGLTAQVSKVDIRIALGSATEAGVVVLRNADGSVGTKVGVRADGTLVVDRRASGDVGFNSSFPSVESSPVRIVDGEALLTLYLDRSSVEVFGDNGQRVITDLVYPPAGATGVAAYAVGGTAKAIDIKVSPVVP